MESRLDRIIDWVKACDTKASIMLALIGVFISMIFTSDFVLTKIQSIVNSIKEYDFHNVSVHDVSVIGFFVLLFLIVSLYFLMGSVYRFILVVYSKHQETLSNDSGKMPRIFRVFDCIFRHSTVCNNDPNTKKDSLISLNHIASIAYDDFKTAIASSDYSKTLEKEDYLSQIYINAKRCKEKFEDYNSAIRWMLYSCPFLFLFYVCLLFY